MIVISPQILPDHWPNYFSVAGIEKHLMNIVTVRFTNAIIR